MPKVIISARYLEQNALEAFLGRIFGYGKASVIFTRGRFQCTLPRGLTEDELKMMEESVEYTHYAES